MSTDVRIAVFVAAADDQLLRLLRDDSLFEIVDDPADAEIAITRTTTRVDGSFLAKMPKLRLVAQGSSGIDNFDTAALESRRIELIHLPGINANAVVELVLGLIITLTRTVPFYHRAMLDGAWLRDDCATRHELRHYRLGIIGFGNVGSRLGRLASGLGMSVAAYDPYVEDVAPASRASSVKELLVAADVVSLHVPLTEETSGMIGPDQFAAMNRGTVLINAARGGVADVEAALDALRDGVLGGLALDVFEHEPPRRRWPSDPRLVLTPHIAGCTHEAKHEAAVQLHRAMRRWVDLSRSSGI